MRFSGFEMFFDEDMLSIIVSLFVFISFVFFLPSKKKKKSGKVAGTDQAETVSQQSGSAEGFRVARPQDEANMTIADLAECARRQTAPADTVAKPTVHVTPHDHSGMFDGSLRADRDGEGQDPHDHGFAPVNMPSMHSDKVLNQSLSETPAPQLSAPGFQLSFAPDQLMSAFVMQEVLGKPGGITRE